MPIEQPPTPEDTKKEKWKEFNNVASGIAALAAVGSVIITTITSNEVNKLSQQARTAGLIGDLTDKLTSVALGRDISLLALEHALNPEPGKNKAGRDKLLLARISSLLTAGNLPSQQNLDSQVQFTKGVDQATNVLKRLVDDSGETCQGLYDSALNLDSKEGNPGQSPDNALAAQRLATNCGEAGAVAVQALLQPIKGRETDGSNATSASQLAQADVVDPDKVAGALAQSRVVSQINEIRLESALKKDVNTLPSRAVVTVHVDDRAYEPRLRGLLAGLSNNRWYIVSGIRTVEPGSPSCGEYSSVRFFHPKDERLAQELIAKVTEIGRNLKRKSGKSHQDLDAVIKGENNRKPGIQSIDLHAWKFSQSVPEQSLELWLIANGKRCAASKSTAIPSGPPA